MTSKKLNSEHLNAMVEDRLRKDDKFFKIVSLLNTHAPQGGFWAHDNTGDYFVTWDGEIFNPCGFATDGIEYFKSSARMLSREEIDTL